MKKNLLDSIVCPLCQREFQLKVLKGDDNEIGEGLLSCGCGQIFPIINSIPRILIGDLRNIVYNNFPEFFLKYQNLFPKNGTMEQIEGENLKKEKTSKSFGYEWNKFSEMREEWEKNFNFYFEPVGNLNLLEGKKVLEASCGCGRHTYYAAKRAKEIIAVDISSAVDVALQNTKECGNVNFIQADIYNLPLRKKSFDFIYSIGVLHHLPEPEEGFRKLVELLKDEASILTYLYHDFPKNTLDYYGLRVIDSPRYFTTKISHNSLYYLCFPIAFLFYLFLVVPYKFLRILGIEIVNWPFNAYANYPFRVLVNDVFDRYATPIANRYLKEEVLGWYQRAGLRGVNILSGWRTFGKK